jgi:PAS domain S-box-containing protein
MRSRALPAAAGLLLVCALPASAQFTSTRLVRQADSARTKPGLGDTTTIAGRVTLGFGVLATERISIYVQDSTGSVLVDADVSPVFADIATGDSVVAAGVIRRSAGGNYLSDAAITLVPGPRRLAEPQPLDALVPTRLASLLSVLVTVDATVAARNIGRGDRSLTVGHADAEGNYVTVIEEGAGRTDLGLERFSPGDRLRITGVLVRRTSSRTGITRYSLYPRAAPDLVPIGITARTKARATWVTGGGLLLALVAAAAWQQKQRRSRARHDSEMELREHAARYRLLVEGAPIGIVVHRDGSILFANTSFAALVGHHDAEGLRGRDLDAFFEPDRLALIRTGTQRVPGSEHPRHFASQIRRLDGETVDVEIADGPVAYEGMECIQAIVHDVTERTRAEKALAESEAQLRQAQKMDAIGQLAGGVAHDFNNILTAIKGNSEFLLEGCVRCGTVPVEATEINQAADRAAVLTHRLLAFSRKQVIQPQVIEVDALIRNLEPMLRRLVPESVEQHFALGGAGQHVNADPGQIEQVILNLVVNARDAMPSGGRLEIRTAPLVVETGNHRHSAGEVVTPGDYLVLAVADTGVGMSAEIQRRVFEPFFSTKEAGKGTGLGLSTVYGIVKQSDGHVAVNSTPGAGTTFTIYLPRVDAETEDRPATFGAGTAPRGDETIMLVEDEEAIRRLAARTLERHGYRVIVADDGIAALAAVRDHPGAIDLLLTDVVLPGLSGADIATNLRSDRSELRVLYMSGYTDDLITHHGVLAPGVELLEKPFTPKQLLERVRRVLDKDATTAN